MFEVEFYEKANSDTNFGGRKILSLRFQSNGLN